MPRKQDDKNTKQHLLECAKEEFLEKGFVGASLRTICQKAGVTTGALYFFFKDKDDLFCSLTTDVVKQIADILNNHYSLEKNLLEQGTLLNDDYSDEYKLGTEIVEMMYAHHDEVYLVLKKSQGSSLEGIINTFVDKIDSHNKLILPMLRKGTSKPPMPNSLIHWISHQQLEMFLYMIEHIKTKEEALEYMKGAMAYSIGGCLAILNND